MLKVDEIMAVAFPDLGSRPFVICLKFARNVFRSLGKNMRDLACDPRQELPDLSDRMARDAGIDPSDLAWRRLDLPSKGPRHPML